MVDLDLHSAHSRLREAQPLIQCITNTVVQQFTANVLLAVGASPAMLDHEADAAEFAGIAGGLLINFGTATNQQFLAADAAIETFTAKHGAWVLDPVSIGAVAFRSQRIRQTAQARPTAIRGNASEIAALAGMGLGGRGVDSTDEVDAVLPAAVHLARETGAVVGVSGQTDAIVAHVDGTDHCVRVHGGHEYMPLVIGTGCSLGAVTTAYLAAYANEQPGNTPAALTAVTAAHAHFAVAGAMAAESANGPGSFAVNFLDALYSVTPEQQAAVNLEVGTIEQGVS